MEYNRDAWTAGDYGEFLASLKDMAEDGYRQFHSRLIPGTQKVMGIRVPALRRIAREILKGNYREFLRCPIGDYHEERIIEGLVIAGKKCDFPELFSDYKYFCGRILNWAVCDTVSFKGIKKYRPQFWAETEELLSSDDPWCIRKTLGTMMEFYLDAEYINGVLEKTAAVCSDLYYVQMMQAWLLATALAKCREETLSFLHHAALSATVWRMTAQKVRDSLRISREDKEEVSALAVRLSRGIPL